MPPRATDPIVLFLSKIDRNGPVVRPDLGACHLWLGGRDADGYGKFQVTLPRDGIPTGKPTKQRHVRAHVFMWETVTGCDLSAGRIVMHKCDNPPCVNPDHLEDGTQGSNRADCFRKGRVARGEGHGMVKTTVGVVLDIRRRHREGEKIKDIAADVGLCKAQTFAIATGRSWGHVDG